MKPPVRLHIAYSSGSPRPESDDPMILAIQHYERHAEGIDEPSLTDEEVGRRFSKALEMIQFEPGPKATTATGAAAALKLVLGFQGVDPTDRALIAGALAYLNERQGLGVIGSGGA